MIWYRQVFSLPFHALRNFFSFYVFLHNFFSRYNILFFGSLDECEFFSTVVMRMNFARLCLWPNINISFHTSPTALLANVV